jgi:hypothetical protein
MTAHDGRDADTPPGVRSTRVLDLSGYAFTGKHAVIDLMREMRGYHVEHFAFEFLLLRIQGGIQDLEHALCGNWSPIRSDAAIHRFRRVIRRTGVVNDWTKPRSYFEATGWNYDAHYNRRYLELSARYIDRLVSASWHADWPFPLVDLSGPELFVRKALAKLRVPGAWRFEVCLSRPDDFLDATREYLDAVLTSHVGPDTTTAVLHNAFEPFDPARCLRYFTDARAIVIDRDPRDNYVQGLWYSPTAVDVDTFITRYRLYRQATRYDAHPRVLRMRFEDLIFSYEATVARILEFLGEDPSVHVRKKQHFDPAISKKNTGIWRAYGQQAEIVRIAAALPEFCDDRT